MSSVNSEEIVGFYTHTFHITDKETWYTSNKFTIKGINNCTFEIRASVALKPARYQLLVMKSNVESKFAEITVSLLGEDITIIVRNWRDSCFFSKEDDSGRYPIYIKVHCQIIWYDGTEASIPVGASLNPFSGFHNFHLNSSLSDLQISIGGEELSAHKLILAAHSPVFLSMFDTDMKEKRENRIVIEGIELNVMKIVLSILYTGCDKDLDNIETAGNVLVVAERYDMKALKRLCEWKLFQKLDVSSVVDLLDKADDNNADALQTACINLIIQNKEKMAKSEDLKTICRRKPDVTYELFEALMITK